VPGKFVEVKHAVVPTMIAEEGHVVSQIHIPKMVRNKTSVASLNAAAEFSEYIFACDHIHFEKILAHRV